MDELSQYQWLYMLFVLGGIAIGILGIQVTVKLVKGIKNSEANALVTLILGTITGGIHMYVSRSLRGSSMPTDFVVYFTVLTLLLFLVFRLPKLRELSIFERENDSESDIAGGITAIVSGALVLSVQIWARSDHLISGVNYADAFHNAMLVLGTSLFLFGSGLVVRSILTKQPRAAVERVSSKTIH
jgi:hypothetical protein